MAHVVQLNKTGIAQMKKIEKPAFDPKSYLEYILSSIPEGKSILYSEDKMLKLFKYLKNVRQSAQNYKHIKNLLEMKYRNKAKSLLQAIWEPVRVQKQANGLK